MNDLEDYLEYLEIQKIHLIDLIGDNKNEFNQGRLYVMNKIIEDLRNWFMVDKIK